MSANNTLIAKKRTSTGTGAARACRNQGFIPGIIYGGNSSPETIMMDPGTLIKETQKPTFFTHVYKLSIEGQEEQVLPKEVQYHPVTDYPLHVDFMRIAKGAKLHLHIPIRFINDDKSPGIKQGGVLNVVHHTLEVIVPEDTIPEFFIVDLTGAETGKAIHIQDLNLPKNICAAHPDRDNTIATIAGSTKEKEETKE